MKFGIEIPLLLILVAMFVIVYFYARRQQKEMRQRKQRILNRYRERLQEEMDDADRKPPSGDAPE